jgi:hypothetical protein
MGDCIQEREGEGTYGEGHPSPREGTYGEGPPRLGFRVSCMRIQEREGTYGEGPYKSVRGLTERGLLLQSLTQYSLFSHALFRYRATVFCKLQVQGDTLMINM